MQGAAVAGVGGAALGGGSVVANTLPQAPIQAPGLNRRRIGDYIVTAISDGYLPVTFDLLSNIDAATASALMTRAGVTAQSVVNINAYVVQGGGRTILVDSGAGGFRGWGGRLAASLVVAGINPSDIDTILMTHAHPDHAGGLADASAFACFSNAELVVNERELAFWRDDGNLSRATERAQASFQVARNSFNAYQAKIRTFVRGEVLPGISALPLPGHTIGHTGYMIESNNQRLLIWGDVVHFPDIQGPCPHVTIAFDQDQAAAADTRLKVFDMVSAENLLIAGMHLNLPSFARIERKNTGYRIVKEEWAPSLI